MKKITLLLMSLFLCVFWISAQTVEVKGVVISEEDNEPVIGASVVVKGNASIGIITDFDGRFSLAVPEGSEKIVVSYVGMETQEVPISGREIRVVLLSDTKSLDEVIVVAYGTAKRSSFTGSASSVTASSIEKRPITSVTQALAGTVPGLQVSSSSGQPGSSVGMRIRGFGSINAGSSPLIVLDGSIYSGSISDINSSDVESMTVLKDAASTSLYGSSAGNGVILITTKKGRAPKPTLRLDISHGFSQRGIPEYDRISKDEFYPIMWEQYRNERVTKGDDVQLAGEKASKAVYELVGLNPYRDVPNDQIVLPDGQLNPNANASTFLWADDLNWADLLERTGHRQQYNMAYNTSSDKSDAYVSIGYLNDKGYVMKSDFQRFTARANVNMQPVKWFKTGVNLSVSRSVSNVARDDSNTGYVNPFFFPRTIGAIYPIHLHNPDGSYLLDEKGEKRYDYNTRRGTGGHAGRHIIAETLWNERNYTRDAVTIRGYADVIFNEHLTATINVSSDIRNYKEDKYDNRLVGDGAPSGRLSTSVQKPFSYTVNQLLKYNRAINNHHLDVTLGHENHKVELPYLYAMKQGQLLDGNFNMINFVDVSELTSYKYGGIYAKEGYFSRLNYDYANKYYASFSYRLDASSKFESKKRWGNFYSLGGSWRMDQEKALQDVDWINSLKLRASYGETGNDAISSYYPYKTLFTLGENNASEGGIIFNEFGNTDLRWETQVSWDVALEFSLFNCLHGTVEYFRKESKDLLFATPIPISSGSNKIWRNVGKVSNQGVELSLRGDVVSTRDLQISLSANATFYQNKIVRLPDENRKDGIISGNKKLLEGHSIYDFWLRSAVGVNPENGDLMYRLDTEKFESKIDEKTDYQHGGEWVTTSQNRALFHYAGSAIPTVNGGFDASITYKGISLKALFNYQMGGVMFDYNYTGLMGLNSYGAALHKDILKRWQKPNDVTTVPRLDASTSLQIGSQSDRHLISSDYLTFRSLSLGYNLPKSIIKPMGLEALSLSVSAENLLTLTKKRGMNPTHGFSGGASNAYVPSKTISLGVNITF